MRIRTLLILASILFSIFASALIAIFVSYAVADDAQKKYSAMVEEVAKTQANNLTSFFASYKRKINVARYNTVINSYAADPTNEEKAAAAQREMNAIIGEDTNITSLYLLSESNGGSTVLMCDSESQYQSADFQPMEAEDCFYVMRSEESETKDYRLVVFYNLTRDVKLVVVSSCAELNRLMLNSSFTGNGRLLLVDPLNNVIDDTKMLGNLFDQNMPEYAKIKEMLDSGLTAPTQVISYEVSRMSRLGIFFPVEGGWTLVATSVSRQADEYAAVPMNGLIWTAVAVCLVFTALGILFSIGATKPLYVIENTLQQIRRGDHEARINLVAKNEYGEIASLFNDLMDDVVVSEGRYRTIVEMSDNVIFEWNLESGDVLFSQNFNRKFSYRAPSDSFEDSFLNKCKLHPDDADRYHKDIEQLAKGHIWEQNEYRWKNMYGDYIWVLIRIAAISDKDGKVMKIVGVVVDIDRAKKNEKVLSARARYDALTGLYKRETVESMINNEIELISVRKNEFAILFVDVDDFKHFNDDFSHATGDQVLQFVARAIQDTIKNFGISGRYGGDEFVICVRNSEINDPARVAQDIIARLKDGFVCDLGERLSVNVSIGISVVHNSVRRVSEIIGQADDAMYKVKKSGKSNFMFVSE
jgi:diguanylate cyclase (GGDEF)-like protein/PAS domain S-box-containing protein